MNESQNIKKESKHAEKKRVTLMLKPGNFERLKKQAMLNKRSLPNQILFLLEGVKTPENAKNTKSL